MSLARVLHREVLRAARALDVRPLGKALLIAQPDRLFLGADQLLKLERSSGTALNELLLAHNSGGEFYLPSATAIDTDAADTTASAATATTGAAPDTTATAASFVRLLRGRGPQDSGDMVDLGFDALRCLRAADAAAAALRPTALAAEDMLRTFDALAETVRVRRVPKGAPIVPGSLLVTHPIAGLAQPTLHRSVILVVDVTDVQVIGVVINKPILGNVFWPPPASELGRASGGGAAGPGSGGGGGGGGDARARGKEEGRKGGGIIGRRVNRDAGLVGAARPGRSQDEFAEEETVGEDEEVEDEDDGEEEDEEDVDGERAAARRTQKSLEVLGCLPVDLGGDVGIDEVHSALLHGDVGVDVDEAHQVYEVRQCSRARTSRARPSLRAVYVCAAYGVRFAVRCVRCSV